MGDPGTDFLEFGRVTEEIHNLLQFFLFFFRTGHIIKGDLCAARHAQGGACLTEIGHGVAAGIDPAHEQNPQNQQDKTHDQRRQNQIIGGKFSLRHKVIALQHAAGGLQGKNCLHFLAEALRVSHVAGQFCLALIFLMQNQVNFIFLHSKALDLLRTEQPNHLRVAQIIHMISKYRSNHAEHQQQNHQIQHRCQ